MNFLTRLPWTLPRALAFGAFVLGALAMFGQPIRGHVVTLDTQELATLVAGEVDHVLPVDLGDRIIRGQTNYRLIDLRDEAAFVDYHIPTAENVPLALLPDWGLARNETIILYSDGGIHAAQAWMLLRAQGFKGVTTLLGGLDGWKEEVVFPVTPTDPSPAQAAQFERAIQIATFFGGQPRDSSASGNTFTSMMPTSATTDTAGPAAATPKGPVAKKKKKEGC